MLFRIENLGKEFSGNWLFRSATAQCNPGERIGLIGRNGAGKTTLINMIEGTLPVDEGTITRTSQLSISRVEQIARLDPDKTVYEEALLVNSDVIETAGALRHLEHLMSEGRFDEEVAHRYEELKARFEWGGGYEYEARTEKILFGLGFSRDDLKRCCSQLSGGQRSRLLLARVLLKPAELLLLDEPTNHLDLSALLWLEDFLKSVSAAILIISHDRHFLDAVTHQTWELEGGRLFVYTKSYTGARAEREERRKLETKQFEQQQEWKKQTEDFIRRNIVGQKTKQAQARQKQLEKTIWLEPPLYEKRLTKIRIPEAGRGGATVVEFRDVSIGFGGNPLLEVSDLTIFRDERIGILGGNGSGKTTFLRTLLGQQHLLGGEIRWGQNNAPAYYAQESQILNPERTVFEILAEISPSATDEEIRNLGARFLFRGDDISKLGAELSGGERSRLAFARLFSRPSNVLVLDEPTNHLDIESREALEAGLEDFHGSLIIVSHDLYFLEKVASRFLLIRNRRFVELDDLSQLAEKLAEPVSSRWSVRIPALRTSQAEKAGLSKNERMRLQQRVEKLELEIHELEARRGELESLMASGDSDHEVLHQLSLEYHELEAQLSDLFRQWEEQCEKLESA